MNAIARDVFRVYRTHKSLALTLTFQPDRFYEFERKKKNLDKEGRRCSIFVTTDFPPFTFGVNYPLIIRWDRIVHIYISSLGLKLDKRLYNNYLSSLINLLVSLIDRIVIHAIDTRAILESVCNILCVHSVYDPNKRKRTYHYELNASHAHSSVSIYSSRLFPRPSHPMFARRESTPPPRHSSNDCYTPLFCPVSRTSSHVVTCVHRRWGKKRDFSSFLLSSPPPPPPPFFFARPNSRWSIRERVGNWQSCFHLAVPSINERSTNGRRSVETGYETRPVRSSVCYWCDE